MSARYPITGDALLWHHEPEQTGVQPKPLLRAWLKETGLLTARLRRLCENGVRLEVVDANARSDQSMDNGIHRRVILYCGEQPCIYAETDIPATTANQHPWLKELGDEPLGERLQSQPDVRRSEFRYAQLMPDYLPPELSELRGIAVWARQSDFHISEMTLTVTEVFLPGLADYQNQRMKLAE